MGLIPSSQTLICTIAPVSVVDGAVLMGLSQCPALTVR